MVLTALVVVGGRERGRDGGEGMGERGGRRLLLTRKLVDAICGDIKRGVLPWVAATGQGISLRTWRYYLARAREIDERFEVAAERGDAVGPDAEERLYLHLLHSVEAASGNARGRAESWVFQHKPDWWLAHGGGRDTGEAPGWRVSDPERQPERRGQLEEMMVTTLRELGMGEAVEGPSVEGPSERAALDSGSRESVKTVNSEEVGTGE